MSGLISLKLALNRSEVKARTHGVTFLATLRATKLFGGGLSDTTQFVSCKFAKVQRDSNSATVTLHVTKKVALCVLGLSIMSALN